MNFCLVILNLRLEIHNRLRWFFLICSASDYEFCATDILRLHSDCVRRRSDPRTYQNLRLPGGWKRGEMRSGNAPKGRAPRSPMGDQIASMLLRPFAVDFSDQKNCFRLSTGAKFKPEPYLAFTGHVGYRYTMKQISDITFLRETPLTNSPENDKFVFFYKKTTRGFIGSPGKELIPVLYAEISRGTTSTGKPGKPITLLLLPNKNHYLFNEV